MGKSKSDRQSEEFKETLMAERVETSERLKTLGASKLGAIKQQATGPKEYGTDYEVASIHIHALLSDWPAAPKRVAKSLLEHYGAPNEATPTKLMWYRQGPWRRMEITKDEIAHNFPTPHTDFLSQFIDYSVLAEKASELTEFDGSLLLDRTAGEMGARCDMEAMNVLTLNLAHDIVTGAKSVNEARVFFAETAAAYTLGRPAPYAENLLFDLPEGDTGDRDDKMMSAAMMDQMKQKAKDVFGSSG